MQNIYEENASFLIEPQKRLSFTSTYFYNSYIFIVYLYVYNVSYIVQHIMFEAAEYFSTGKLIEYERTKGRIPTFFS